jgi:hypothetical protein
MNPIYLNHWAIVTSSVLFLVLGGLWYSPLMFYKGWIKETGLTDEKIKTGGTAKKFIISYILALVMAYNLAFFLGDSKTDWVWGLTAGFLAGFGWATLSFIVIALFEQRSWKYIFINGGFITLYLSITGLIIGLWR